MAVKIKKKATPPVDESFASDTPKEAPVAKTIDKEIKQGTEKVTVAETHAGATVSEKETVKVVTEELFCEPTANVGMSAGFTHNMGDYNSVKVQVSLHIPCLVKDIDSTIKFVKDWVSKRVEEMHCEITGEDAPQPSAQEPSNPPWEEGTTEEIPPPQKPEPVTAAKTTQKKEVLTNW